MLSLIDGEAKFNIYSTNMLDEIDDLINITVSMAGTGNWYTDWQVDQVVVVTKMYRK